MSFNLFKKVSVAICLSLPISALCQVKHDTLHLGINEQNTIYVKTLLNKTKELTLNFDTGCTDLILTTEVLKNKLNDSIKLYHTNYPFQIGKTIHNTKIYDAQLTGHGTDGRFGWNFFSDKTVELNYDKEIMVIHDELPLKILSDKTYTKLPIKIIESLPYIETKIIQNEETLRDFFLFDTGYQRTAMLDNENLKMHNFPIDKMKELKRVIMYGGQGNEVPVITSDLEILQIGDFQLKNVPVQQIIENKPMRNRKIHILGNEVLKRFNVFMDYKNGYVYMKPNHFFNTEYIESAQS